MDWRVCWIPGEKVVVRCNKAAGSSSGEKRSHLPLVNMDCLRTEATCQPYSFQLSKRPTQEVQSIKPWFTLFSNLITPKPPTHVKPLHQIPPRIPHITICFKFPKWNPQFCSYQSLAQVILFCCRNSWTQRHMAILSTASESKTAENKVPPQQTRKTIRKWKQRKEFQV